MSNRRVVFIMRDDAGQRHLMVRTRDAAGMRNFLIPNHITDDVALYIARVYYPAGTENRHALIAAGLQRHWHARSYANLGGH